VGRKAVTRGETALKARDAEGETGAETVAAPKSRDEETGREGLTGVEVLEITTLCLTTGL
jgi:hypothetical protein